MKSNLIYSSQHVAPVSAVGGKGHHLQQLVSWGARVAPFFIIGTNSSSQVDPEVEAEILSFIEKHKTVVFRSSMVGEDQLEASYAGLFETVLGVGVHNWKEALHKVYSSLESSRVQNYIAQKKLDQDLKMAVVVQKEIKVEKSGVLFTRSPLEPTSAIAIDAGLGMGEGVVSGHVDVDHYLLTRLGEMITGHDNQVLSTDEIKDLYTESLRLERKFGKAADIEWGIAQENIYFFQIRPITQSFSSLKVFADTNLSESYPGNVSPFTASFVRGAYESVFMEAANLLGYGKERLELLHKHCSQLISVVDHHLYYNLEHYYAVLRSLPGGEKNISNWHKMIGGKVNGSEVPYHATQLSSFELVTAFLSLIKIGFKKKYLYSSFLHDLKNHSDSIEAELRTLKNSRQTLQYMDVLLKRPLGFGITIINDFFIMIGLGVLTSRLKTKNLKEDLIIDLLKTDHALDSIKPLHAFNELVTQLSEPFLMAFQQSEMRAGYSPYENTLYKLKEKWPDDVSHVTHFLDLYGDRSFEELKIESLPLKNDPHLFKRLIEWGRHNKSRQVVSRKNIQPVKLNFFEHKLLVFTRECIEFRETSRLWRGRFYHFLRQVMIKLAEQLQKENPSLAHFSVQDFFSITPIEWNGFLHRQLTIDDLKTLIEKRVWQRPNQIYPEFIIWNENEKLPQVQYDIHLASYIQGQGVSPGVIEAKALVLENPGEVLDIHFEDFILVTKNTDPAWVYIMSRSKGLISEKGSMLSHTAIIGRELGIPTVVGVKHATHLVKTGDKLRINGTTGEVSII